MKTIQEIQDILDKAAKEVSVHCDSIAITYTTRITDDKTITGQMYYGNLYALKGSIEFIYKKVMDALGNSIETITKT